MTSQLYEQLSGKQSYYYNGWAIITTDAVFYSSHFEADLHQASHVDMYDGPVRVCLKRVTSSQDLSRDTHRDSATLRHSAARQTIQEEN